MIPDALALCFLPTIAIMDEEEGTKDLLDFGVNQVDFLFFEVGDSWGGSISEIILVKCSWILRSQVLVRLRFVFVLESEA